MDTRNNKMLEKINQAYEMIDDIYGSYAGSFGISDTEFWILYALAEHSGDYMQTDICRDWYYSLQTIHTAIKNMEKRGLVTLVCQPGNKKNKYIHLTETGVKLVEQISEPLMEAEEEALDSLTKEEQEISLPLLQKHANALKVSIGKRSITKEETK